MGEEAKETANEVGGATAPGAAPSASPAPPVAVTSSPSVETPADAGSGSGAAAAATASTSDDAVGGADAASAPSVTTDTSSSPSVVTSAARASGKSAVAEPAYYKRRKKRGNELCQILIRNGDVDPVYVRRALKIQEERGGQIGRILVRLGACSEAAISRALLQQLHLKDQAGVPNLSAAARESPAIAGLKITCSPWRTRAALVTADLGAFAVAVLLGLLLDYHRTGGLRFDGVTLTLPAAGIGVIAFFVLGLYSAMPLSPPDELRSSTLAITWLSGAVAAFGLAGEHIIARYGTAARLGTLPSLATFWLVAAALVPLMRAFVRNRFANRPWWGHPAIVLGAARTGRLVVRALRAQPSAGLKPVVLLDDNPRTHGTLRANIAGDSMEVRSFHQPASELLSDSMKAMARDLLSDSIRLRAADLLDDVDLRDAKAQILDGPKKALLPLPDPDDELLGSGPESTRRPPPTPPPAPIARARGMFAEVEGVPVVGELAIAPMLAKRLGIEYAILAMPGVASRKLIQISERVAGVFPHVLIIPDLFGFATLGVPARNVAGILAIEVRQQLLLRGPRITKRVVDLLLTVAGGVFVLPIILLLALLIKVDSRGPVLYFQERLGRDGSRFRAAKFRTMHGDGEARLKAVLDADAAMRAEYEEFHKLTNDPRVTRVGRILRKYSLDELPQLLNVLKGEMSLVGPRPYLAREIPDMGEQEGIILRAMPGMTGMWQVSDRNATGFAQRLAMDVYYVRNWSPWLDIYLLARTFRVVVAGTGV